LRGLGKNKECRPRASMNGRPAAISGISPAKMPAGYSGMKAE
jgi:hypothetical protein